MSEAIAAGMAEMGSLVVPPCYFAVSMCSVVRMFFFFSFTYDHSVETGRVETGDTLEVLGGVELVLESLLIPDGAITVGRSVVESLVNSGSGCREGEDRCSSSTHLGLSRYSSDCVCVVKVGTTTMSNKLFQRT